ncbi:uncharacterized protein LOC131328422 [Rhododendron vialii]|uniref:uncharacterized protein LOC131328422 n=1 Tax=Rhododendron vialii TaxID=182163 RepID=UPI00265FBAF9|nr:uncharacterized protein LOC131328422 [Rhododendron vialii]
MWNKLFCQNVAILKCLWKGEEKRKKDNKEMRQLARQVGKLRHELQWHTQYVVEEGAATYEPPPEEELVDSSVEEEKEEDETEEDSKKDDEEGDGDDGDEDED